ncbi:hypothetical protein PanWU01x14_074500 [Parasponia andersonii]|uniref:Uncharacterized protein n=1 Tax=Parasponia andersonii TaxID=3476 RepID=A0A2P5DDI8_PARAD|nr:hypothetical protein PanWU01x14_074500 [Parasponia andersonii]
MTTFNPGKMGLRYIYLDDPCNETNPTRPVGGRMVAGIVAGSQKTETTTFSSPATVAPLATLPLAGAGSWWARELRSQSGGWTTPERRVAAVILFRPMEIREREFWGERE